MELVQWFKDRAPVFVPGYIGAIRLLHEPSYSGRLHFVCHAIRDIYRFLPGELGIRSGPRQSEVLPQLARDLAKYWHQQPEPLRSDKYSRGQPNEYPSVTVRVHDQIRLIAEKCDELKPEKRVGSTLAIALFKSQKRRDDAPIPPRIIRAFDEEYDWFMERAHLNKVIDTEDGLRQHVESFERAMHALVCSYFSGRDELDAILQQANNRTN